MYLVLVELGHGSGDLALGDVDERIVDGHLAALRHAPHALQLDTLQHAHTPVNAL